MSITNTQLANTLSTLAQDTVVISTPIALLAAGEVLQNWVSPQVYFIADQNYEILSIREAHDFLQTSADGASIQITKLTGTTAPGGSELNLITTDAYVGSGRTDKGFDLKGIAINTVTNATLTTVATSLNLATGDRLVWGANGTIETTFISLTTVLRKR